MRSNHSEQFNRPTWHYVTAAYVPPYSKLKPSDLPGSEPNVVTQISVSSEKIRSGTASEKSIYLCWLLHLVGDIHQPLHCCSQLSEAFPVGDRGGNLAIVRLAGGTPERLHFIWDAMLGDEIEPAAILKTVDELKRFECEHPETVARELQCHATAALWAQEGFELARTKVYLNGDLRPCHADDQAREELIPTLSDQYVAESVTVSRFGAVKAGRRLAASLAGSLP